MRLIDADALKAEFTGNFHEMWHYTGIRAMIDVAPAVDAVEVVRCKDCIHWSDDCGIEDRVCLKIYSDGAVSQYAWQERKPDDFCSYGERR